MLTVDLPIAVPVIFAGLRVVTVANISIVSVGAIIGIGGLGELFTDGFQKNFLTPVVVGIVLSVALALAADLLIVDPAAAHALGPHHLPGQGGVTMFQGMLDFLTDPANWSGAEGIGNRILQHLWYTGLALLIAALIALPVGLLIGHTRRGAFLAINTGNAARALPTLGLLMLIVLLMGRIGFLPVLIALVVLGIPPILTSTYAGISGVDGATIDAARGMGMTETRSCARWRSRSRCR